MSKLETRAVVVSIDGLYAIVQPNESNGCGHCNGKGCGTSNLSRLFCHKPRQFRVKNSIEASVGDSVIVSVAEGAILRGIGLVYLMPLVLLVIGGMLGSSLPQQIEQSDSYAAVGALCGLVAGFGLAKWIALRQTESQFQPYIAQQLPRDT